MKRFDENPTRAGRALQIYLIPIGYARSRQVLTYGELGRLTVTPMWASSATCSARSWPIANAKTCSL